MTIIATTTRNVLRRDWHSIEPKLLAFLATGITGAGVIAGAEFFGITLDPALASLVVIIAGAVAGFVKASTTTIVTPIAAAVDPQAALAAAVASGIQRGATGTHAAVPEIETGPLVITPAA